MENQKDAFGQMILAYLNGQYSYEILERNDGVIDPSFEAVKTYFNEFENWQEHEKKAIRLVKGNILDVGAGAGRVSLYLQKIGFDVTAIDKSPLAIDVCKKRGVRDAKQVPIENVNKLKVNTFESVVMFGNGFGLFGNIQKAKRILKSFHKITKKNAYLLVESADPYISKDPLSIYYREMNLKKGRMPGQFRLRVRFQHYKSDWFDFLFVSRQEMEMVIAGTGWRIKDTINLNDCLYISILEKV